MSDNSSHPLLPPITDKDGTYNYRLKYNSNDEPYKYIKEYESDMKWYKKYIIIPVIILIILIALIIRGFIKSDVIVIVIGFIFGVISGLVLWYFNTEYKNSKDNRDRYIQNAKDEIEEDIKREEADEKRKEAEKKLIDKAKKEKQEYIDKLTPEMQQILPKVIKTNQIKILEIITEGNKKNSDIDEISRNIIKYMNKTQFSDYFFKYYESNYLDPLIEDNDIYKDIISGIKLQINDYNKMSQFSKSDYLDPRPTTKTDYSSNDDDYSHEKYRYRVQS